MIDPPNGGWSFATARESARFGACLANRVPGLPHLRGVQHAGGADGTLCGIPERRIARVRSLFVPDDPRSCPRCREEAESAPTQPCVQERLHDRVLESVRSEIRDELLAALREGANVPVWLNCPSTVAQHYARLDGLTDGAGPAAEALAAAARPGVANVEHDRWRFLVVLPEDGRPPVVARGPRDLG
ncbi:hypothetical protein [Kitasatospora terrestris]|uniref:hypothetical protein n=1 Tax=Kitasatospora terrestris TaxID=258051 RepID=UPI0031EB8325